MKINGLEDVCVVDKPLDVLEEIRKKTVKSDIQVAPFYIGDLTDVVKKHRTWTQLLPRVIPFYGKVQQFVVYLDTLRAICYCFFFYTLKGFYNIVFFVQPSNVTKARCYLSFSQHWVRALTVRRWARSKRYTFIYLKQLNLTFLYN